MSHPSPPAIALPIPRAYPEPAAYARTWRRVKEIAQTNPDVSGWIWGSYDTAQGHLRRFDEALQARINQRGQLRLLIDPYEEAALRRDQRRLHDYLQRRIAHAGSGFETEVCRRRFPAVHARMKEGFDA